MTIQSLATFFLAIFIFSITPGPGVFALLASGMTKGAKQSISLAFGMTISDIIYLLLACYGLAAIATNYSTTFIIIQYMGAFYLFYLGYKMFTAPININLENKKVQKKDFLMGFLQGFLISASNPKVILFYIAFLPTFLDLNSLTQNDIIWITAVAFIGLMMGLMSIAIMANKAKIMLRSKKALSRLNKTAGSIMFGAGIFLLTKD